MTILILREGPGAKSLIQCNTCGLQEERLTCVCKKSKFHYCDIECRFTKPSKYPDYLYRKDRQKECRDAKLKIEHQVKKRCITCSRIYWGPPGGFPKSRDPDEPEPGQCGCKTRTVYREEDYHQQDHVGIGNG